MEKLQLFAETLFQKHNTRMWRKEKDAFLKDATLAFENLGYDEVAVKEDKNPLGITSRNLVVGKPDADILITAHYDTPGRNGFLLLLAPVFGALIGSFLIVMPLGFLMGLLATAVTRIFDIGQLNLMIANPAYLLFAILLVASLIKNPKNHNDNTSGVLGVYQMAKLIAENPALKERTAFVLFDHEEVLPGLLGSKAFAKWRKKHCPGKVDATVINLDCIGVGDVLTVMTRKKHVAWHNIAEFLEGEGFTVKKVRGGLAGNSDHAPFARGVSLLFQKRSLIGPLYIPKIHSGRDKVCDLEQIERLSAAVYRYL